MKTTKTMLLLATFFLSVLLHSCKDDPETVNEEELVTTVRLTFTPTGGGITSVLQYRDTDGDGGIDPVITADTLSSSQSYSVAIEVLNESISPADTITHEIMEEGEEHQFFFESRGGLNLTFDYFDQDSEGHPIGLAATAQAGAASAGTLTVTLRHEPDKHAAGVEDGDITNAGGETDIEVTFDVVIQ